MQTATGEGQHGLAEGLADRRVGLDECCDLVDRGLNYQQGLLAVIDGAKALAAGVTSVFGDHAVIQRCQIHKRRNVAGYLPKTDRDRVDARLRGAFADPDPAAGLRKAQRLAGDLKRTPPDAAGSLREGLGEMFTVRRLGIDRTLARTLVCTNMIESMISICRTTSRNVKRWQDQGDMRRRRPPRSRKTIPTSPRLPPNPPPPNRPHPPHPDCHTPMPY